MHAPAAVATGVFVLFRLKIQNGIQNAAGMRFLLGFWIKMDTIYGAEARESSVALWSVPGFGRQNLHLKQGGRRHQKGAPRITANPVDGIRLPAQATGSGFTEEKRWI
ncbi:MAG: hypothetical protein H6898_06870 [Rhodobacter sp.]|nr:hypothetical protein [Paracoccaceae bacterium]MCC0076296.1 hypothetical protein [Rhodobacter sp.]